MDKKICFVAMGFGKKMDYQNAQNVNLDRIYEKVIKPLFEEELQEYKLIRADEVSGSALIDVAMYDLLLNAELVIADLTTLNPNAIYELGIRHASRPFSTIIMVQNDNKLPFDLDHSRYIGYKKISRVFSKHDADCIRKKLKDFIKESEKETTDSPFYTFLPHITPPTINKREYECLIKKVEENDKTITKLIEKAKSYKKQGNFKEAISCWKALKKALPNNEYVIQQLALATYKSKKPNKMKALENALDIIKELKPDKSLDLETLAITGAIYKRLYLSNAHNYYYLDEAIKYYRKGYIIKEDYYNGENYANCLLMKTTQEDSEQLAYLHYEIKNVYSQVQSLIYAQMEEGKEDYWMYATLATVSFYFGKQETYEKYKKMFCDSLPDEWEIKSFEKNIKIIQSIMR